MPWKIPMSSPDLTEVELEAVTNVLKTPHLSIGPQIDTFERALAAYVGTEHAVGVSSGTAGLHLAVIAANVREGDFVITTPFSFVSSANVILYERAIPIFVDVDVQSGNIDSVQVEAAVAALSQGGAAAEKWLPPALRHAKLPKNFGARLKAILPVHVFGQPADMDRILETARKHNLIVIEDACEALDAEYRGHKAGTLGEVGVYAFYPNKQLTTGEGGMIVTARADWDALFRSLRNQGREADAGWLQHARLGYNYRLDEMSAALGLAQLQRLEELIAKRAQVARWYDAQLATAEFVEIPPLAPTTTRMSRFVYVVRLRAPLSREQMMAELGARGIPTRPYFAPIHLLPFYAEKFGYRSGDFPVAEALGKASLALPFSSVMSEEQVAFVVEQLLEVTKELSRGHLITA